MTPHARFALPLLLAFLLAACAVTPQTPEEGVAAAYTAIESLAESVVTARDNGYLSDERAQEAKGRLQRAHDLVTGAREALDAGREDEAGSLLSRARSVLSVVRETVEGL